MGYPNDQESKSKKSGPKKQYVADRRAGQIDVQALSAEELRALTDTELRRCINSAENLARCPGHYGALGLKNLRKLIPEFNRRHPGRKPPRWQSIPPPPPNYKK